LQFIEKGFKGFVAMLAVRMLILSRYRPSWRLPMVNRPIYTYR